ncbi:fibronectin type III domain-containing protein, partial [candidate division KSB1 bacterium]|nr:fibronectin type III domain-containing protein [candidate division KSB1 bacterium]
MKKVRLIVNKLSILLLLNLLFYPRLFAGELNLSWDPNTEVDLAGYKVYYGLTSRNYTNSIDVGDHNSYIVRNLTEGSRYYLAVTAYDESRNESDYSEEVSAVVKVIDVTPPNPPSITDATLDDINKVTLTWNISPDADVVGYKVYYGTSSHNYTQAILVGNSTNYTTPTLTEGLTYFFSVTAYDNSNNESNHSSEVSVTVPVNDVIPPAVPTITSYDTFERKISLAWNNVSDPDLAGYKVYYGTKSRTYDQVIVVGKSLNYTTADLSYGVRYYFAVTSFDAADNESAYSGEVAVTITQPDNTPPAPPNIAYYNRDGNKVYIAWQGNTEPDVAGYKIHYGESPRAYSQVVDLQLKRDYQTPELNVGKTYYFAVTAYDTSENTSDYSTEVSVQIPAPDIDAPAPPAILSHHIVDKSVSISWSANSEKDLRGYHLYYGKSSANYDTKIDVGTGTNYTVSNLDYGIRYFFAVTALDTAANESAYSQEVSIIIPVPDTTPPSVPLISSYYRQDKKVYLSWDEVGDRDLAGYKVHYGFMSRTYDMVIDVKNTNYLTKDLEEGVSYFFAVTAYDSLNNSSDFSTEIVVTIPAPDIIPPALPTIMSYHRQGNQVSLQWNANQDEDFDHFKLYIGRSSRNYTTTIDVGKNTSYLASDLEYGLTYFFALTAIDTASNESNYSAEVTVEIPPLDLTAPSVPSFVTASRQLNRISLTWTQNNEADFDHYLLHRGNSSGNYDTSLNLSKNTSYITEELQVGKTYYFALTAVDTADNVSDYSAEAIVTIPVPDTTPPSQPVFSDYSRLDNKVLISWNLNSEKDLAGYRLSMGTASKNYHELIDIGLATSYTTRALDYGKTYYFAISAYDTANNFSVLSEEVAVHIPLPDNTPPQVPAISVHERRKYQVFLEWNAVSDKDLEYYSLYYGKSSGNYDVNINNAQSLSYTTPELDHGVTFYFSVTATDTAGNESAHSREVKVTIPVPDVTAPSAPLISEYGLQEAKVYLKWQSNREPDVAGYNVYYGTSAGNYSEKKDVGDHFEFLSTDLVIGSKYFFVVTAYDTARNESASSNEINVTISVADKSAPSAPIITQYVLEETKARLQWSASPEADVSGYRLYYGVTSNNYSHSIDVGLMKEYVTRELDQGKYYYFAVTAYDTVANESKHSPEVSLYIPVIDKTSPQIPVITQHNYDNRRVSLGWLNSPDSDLAGYKVHYGNSSRMYDETIDVGTKTNFTSNELIEGLTYYFAVTAYDTAANHSDYSNEVNLLIPIPDTQAPANPVISNYSIADNRVTINWQANSENDVVGYKVHSGQSSGNYTTSMDVNNNTTFTSGKLEYGVFYYYAVTAYDEADNQSGYSAEIEVLIPEPDLTAPAAPIISSYNLEQDRIHVTWMKNSESDVAGYRFHYGTASGVYSDRIDVHQNLEYRTPVLQRGVKYYFTVTAYDTVGNESVYAQELNIKIPDLYVDSTPPSKPRFSNYYFEGTTVHLEWDNNNEDDLGGYRLYQGKASKGYDDIADMGLKTSHTLINLEEGVTYFFALSAYDTLSNESELSDEIRLTVPDLNIDVTSPSIPVIVSYNVDQNRIRVAWNPNPEADIAGYRFYYGTDSHHYSQSVDVGNALNYTTRELVRGVKYYFALTAYDSSKNESEYSSEISLKIPDQVIDQEPPQVPLILSHEIIGGSVRLNWQANNDADLAGYRLYYGTQSKQYDVSIDVGNSVSYVTRELERGTEYYFSLLAYDLTGNVSEFSAELHVRMPEEYVDITAPEVPQIASATVIDRQVRLVWNSVSNSDLAGYKVYYGTKLDNYDVVADAGKHTEYVTDNLSEGLVYYFVITSYDTVGNESDFSAYAAAEIPVMDIVPPTIYAVDILDSVTVNVLYSEAVDKASAENVSNYRINNGIQVFKVLRDDNTRLVTVTTSEHQKDIEYTLTINNVKDTANNPNVIKANSSITYHYDPEDHKAPFIINAIAVDATHIEITFNEELERGAAENLANYAINNGIELFGARLDESLRIVTLTTSAHTNNVHYLVTVNNVTDRAPQPNAIAPNSQFGYVYIEKDTEPPRLYSAEIKAKDQVLVSFTEIVNEASAENVAHYTIDQNITVMSAVLHTNLKQVTLTTSAHQISLTYQLVVNQVIDRAVPGNVIDAQYNSYKYRYSPQDDQPPAIDLVKLLDATHVDLTFSEEIERKSAEKATNYSISEGIGVISAVLDQNCRIVHLTTTEHQSGHTYQMTVDGIIDRAPVPNAIDEHTIVKYRYSISDMTPPEIVDVVLINSTEVNIIFDEIIDRVSAEEKMNYTFNNGIQVYKAFLREDLKTVSLSTSEHKTGVRYEVSVTHIKDRALPVNMITETQRFSYEFSVAAKVQEVIVTNLNLNHYQLGFLNVKDQYYIDRSYVINRIPAGYEGLLWIKTANDDRYETKNAYLSFDLTKGATLYIAFDGNARNVPSWLRENYTSTGKYIEVSGYSEKMEIWERHFDKGHITLGANSASGSYGVESMYIVLIKVDKNELENGKRDGAGGDELTATDDVKLYQNYPNPFNAGTEIRFQIPEDSYVTLTIYNILGQTVRHLAEGERQASQYVLHWDGRNSEGNLLPSGVYFLRLEVIRRTVENGKSVNKVLFNNVRKMLFLK